MASPENKTSITRAIEIYETTPVRPFNELEKGIDESGREGYICELCKQVRADEEESRAFGHFICLKCCPLESRPERKKCWTVPSWE